MTQDEKYQYYLTFRRYQQSREKAYAPRINKALQSQYAAFISQFKLGASPETALLAVQSTGIIKAISPLYLSESVTYADIVRRSIKMQQHKARMPMGFSQRIADLMQQYYYMDILNTSEGITQTTRELISKVLSEAATGSSINDIVAILEQTELSRKRSRVIARTESVAAANGAGLVTAKDTGLEMKKEWLSTMDDRTRRDHLTANGQIVGLDDLFKVGGFDMQHPGDKGGKNGQLPVPAKEVVNCRCTTLYLPQN